MESDDRGRKAEEVVGRVLAIMKREGMIADFYQNKQHCEVDMLGMDFIVYLLKNGFMISLQVKAGSKDNENRRTKHMKKHPHVPFMIFVNLELYKVCPEKVLDCIMEEIKDFLKG